MVELILGGVLGLGLFIGGLAVGAHNAPTIDKAIATIKTAETNAQATLAKITAHKAS